MKAASAVPRMLRPSALSAGSRRLLSTVRSGAYRRAMVVGDGTVPLVSEQPDNLEALNEALSALRLRHPGAIIERYLDRIPSIDATALVCSGAAIVGDVRLAEGASVWYGAVCRGDMNYIEIGAHSNIQDGTVVHLGDNDPTIVGEHVVVGHRAVLHGCTLERHSLIGMQATVLDGAVIGAGSIVGAGAIVSAGTVVPPRSLVLGVPGKVVKTLPEEKEEAHRKLAEKYARLASNYRLG